MKSRQGFVSNSSSSSFLCHTKLDILKSLFDESLNERQEEIENEISQISDQEKFKNEFRDWIFNQFNPIQLENKYHEFFYEISQSACTNWAELVVSDLRWKWADENGEYYLYDTLVETVHSFTDKLRKLPPDVAYIQEREY